MNILQVSALDHGGCAYHLAEAITQATEHTAKAVRQAQPSFLRYPSHFVAASAADLKALWEWADIVHIHDVCPPLPVGLKRKPIVVTYHGTMYRRNPTVYNSISQQRGWVNTVATYDLMEYGPRWMPDCRAFDLDKYVHRVTDKFIIAHAPTSRWLKNTDEVATLIEQCPEVELDIIERVANEDCLQRKGRASLYIDQFRLGCYGLNAIEAWLMHQPVIGGIDEKTSARMEDAIGYAPFMVASLDNNLCQAVTRLRMDQKLYQEYVDKGRDCVARFHGPKAAARIAFEYYHEALDMGPGALPVATRGHKGKQGGASWPGPVPTARIPRGGRPKRVAAGVLPGEQGFALLRYLGGNKGRMTVFGPATQTKYEVSAKEPLFYVDARDAPGLCKPRTRRHAGIAYKSVEFELVIQ